MRTISVAVRWHGSRLSLCSAGMTGRENAQANRSFCPIPVRALFSSSAWPERDVAEAQAAVPEQDGFVVALAARLQAGDDLAELGVQRLFAELAGFDVGAQRAELAALALAPIVDHQLGHDVGERQLHRAHGAVGHDERAVLDPVGLEQRLGLHQARGFDHDVGALDRVFPIVERRDRLAEVARQLRRRIRRGFPCGANARGSRRNRTACRAGARSNRRCRARRYGPAPCCPCARGTWRRAR